MQQETSNVTVRMPVDRQQQIDAIAQQADRSRNWIINQAVAHYLSYHEEQAHQLETALHQAHAKIQIDGATLIEHWQKHGVIGSRPDIEDSQEHARKLRHDAQTRR